MLSREVYDPRTTQRSSLAPLRRGPLLPVEPGQPISCPAITGHPYYEALYGDNALTSKNHAVNLLTLFDEVMLPPADEYLPDHIQYRVGNQYYHPDLGIRVGDEWDFLREADRIAEKLMRESDIAAFIVENTNLPNDIKFFLGRLIEQLRLATKHGAVIVGGEAVGRLAAKVWRLVQYDVIDICGPYPSPDFFSFEDDSFKVTALTWECEDVESLKAIRTSSEIKSYSLKFRKALFEAVNGDDMKKEMRRLMREAMDSEAIAKKAKGAFETVGALSNSVGAIPVLGTPATLAGLGAFLGGKKAERSEQEHQWYLLGVKMREADLRRIVQEG